MSARLLTTLLSAALLTGCAVPDIYSLPDLARGMATKGKGAAVDAAPVRFVLDGASGPSACDFQALAIYQPDVPVHRISFSTTERRGGKVVSTGGGEIDLPLDPNTLSFYQTADGPAYRWMSKSRDFSCDQVEFEIKIECMSGQCPPYVAAERSDRGERVPMEPVLTTSF